MHIRSRKTRRFSSC